MLKKRIIPCLDIIGDRTVKGTNFLNLKDAGDPVELSKKYIKEGADELIYLDINATIDNKNIFVELVKNIGKNASTFVKKPIALLNPVKIKGLLPPAKAPFGLLPAAGETGIKGMTKMLEKTKLDFLLDRDLIQPDR